MPFCVSSFSALVKGRDFFLIFSPRIRETLTAAALCAAFCATVALLKRLRLGKLRENIERAGKIHLDFTRSSLVEFVVLKDGAVVRIRVGGFGFRRDFLRWSGHDLGSASVLRSSRVSFGCLLERSSTCSSVSNAPSKSVPPSRSVARRVRCPSFVTISIFMAASENCTLALAVSYTTVPAGCVMRISAAPPGRISRRRFAGCSGGNSDGGCSLSIDEW